MKPNGKWFVPLSGNRVLAPTKSEVTQMAVGIFESQMKHSTKIYNPDGFFKTLSGKMGDTITIRKFSSS